MNEELLKELAAAVVGLTYPSESDEPWDVVCWPDAGGDAGDEILQRTGKTSACRGARAAEAKFDYCRRDPQEADGCLACRRNQWIDVQ